MNLVKSVVILFCISVTTQFLTTAQNLQWEPVPLVSQKIINSGNTGGEGCQWPQAIEADHTDGSFLLFGTDVGGIYRSINGGKSWEPCNIGYNPRGNCGFAIDPNNKNRAIAVGANSTSNQSHGLYLSTDMGASWKNTLAIDNYKGYRGFKDKIAFVKGSFDGVKQASMIAYWSNPAGGIYKSENGGETWMKVNNNFGDCILNVHPENGFVYVSDANGFYKSTDRGNSFVKKLEANVSDFDVLLKEPNTVYLSTTNKLYKSVDGGESFSVINGSGYPSNVVTLKVCPSNPKRMAVCNSEGDYTKTIYFSEDGGVSWQKSQMNNSKAFMPFNGRTHKFAWHPTSEYKVWAFGGDWITSSSDGGKIFEWDANGYNGVLVGGMFNFNISNPDLLYVASQDYNGAFTADGGKTWKYCNASGLGWGGFTYGAYAANKDVLVTQVSPAWHQPGNITISRDGGNTFTKTSLICDGLETATGDAKDQNVIYFSNYRSTDLGLNWTKMTGCKGVLIANLHGEKEVYGAIGTQVVKSVNKGETWLVVGTFPDQVADVAVDHLKNRLYVVVKNNRLFIAENGTITEITTRISVDQYSNRTIKTVAVDPVDPSVVYVAGPMNVYKTDASVKRSVDSGQTWQIITPNVRNKTIQKDGANEVFALRVHHRTRELWAAGGCYGVWKERSFASTSTSLMRLNHKSEFLIYPNPSDGSNLTVKGMNVTEGWKISIFNQEGKLIYCDKLNSETTNLPDISGLSSGIYPVWFESQSYNKVPAKVIIY